MSFLIPRIRPGEPRQLLAVCTHCGTDKVAVPDSDGLTNKACPRCGWHEISWMPAERRPTA